MIRLISPFIALLIFTSCARTVSRVNPDQQIDLSGRWNDSDSRMVAQKMINEFLSSDKFKDYSKALNKKPSIIVGLIRNKTSEHIDADNFIKTFELLFSNSGTADLVESDSFRDKLRQERAEQQDFASNNTAAKWGMENGANNI